MGWLALMAITTQSIARLTIGAAIAVAAPAFAESPRSLPEGWTLSDDARYAPPDKRPLYSSPAPRRGVYAHGTSGDLESAPGADEAARRCHDKTGSFPGDSGLSREEYWYFEADGEALLLLRKNTLLGYDVDCHVKIGSDYTVERAMIGSHGFTKFTETGTGWQGETRQFREYRRVRDDIAIGNDWLPLERFVMRLRHFDEGVSHGRIGKVPINCMSYLSPPDAAGGQCWDAGPGPGRGIVTYDYVLESGLMIYQHVTELEDGIALDGRLFEWDRPIRKSARETRQPG